MEATADINVVCDTAVSTTYAISDVRKKPNVYPLDTRERGDVTPCTACVRPAGSVGWFHPQRHHDGGCRVRGIQEAVSVVRAVVFIGGQEATFVFRKSCS